MLLRERGRVLPGQDCASVVSLPWEQWLAERWTAHVRVDSRGSVSYYFVPGLSDGSHPGRGSRDATDASRERYTM